MKRKYMVIAAAAALMLSACGSSDDGDANATGTDTATTQGTGAGAGSPETPQEALPGECAYTPDGRGNAEFPPADPTVEGAVDATMTLNIDGADSPLNITLDAAAAPCTVNSFVSLAEQSFYDDTPCHRLTTAGIFVLQCGDPTGQGNGGPGYTIPDEFRPDMTYGPGTLAMANTGAPNSGGSQFFIVYGGEDDQLPPQYTVFGQITSGLEAVEQVGETGAEGGAPDGAPASPVDIASVRIN